MQIIANYLAHYSSRKTPIVAIRIPYANLKNNKTLRLRNVKEIGARKVNLVQHKEVKAPPKDRGHQDSNPHIYLSHARMNGQAPNCMTRILKNSLRKNSLSCRLTIP